MLGRGYIDCTTRTLAVAIHKSIDDGIHIQAYRLHKYLHFDVFEEPGHN